MFLSKFQIGTSKGFSLPEMLIVLLILSTALTLIGPLTVSRVEKQKHKQELKELKTSLMYYQLHAKWSNEPVIVLFEGKNFTLLQAGKPKEVKKFETLSFQKQSITLYSSGFASECNIKLSDSELLKEFFAVCEKTDSPS